MNIEDCVRLVEKQGLTVNCFGGQCPVQVHAYWPDNGNHLYFRGRGNHWDVTVATNENDAIDGDPSRETVLYYDSKSYGQHMGVDAGYMPLSEVVTIVLGAIKAGSND